MGLLHNGFELKAVEEAEPPEEMMELPGMMLLVTAAARKAARDERM